MSQSRKARARSDSGTVMINQRCAIVGSLTLQGDLYIEGTVDGEVWCTGLQIAERGAVEGLIVAERVVVLGEFKGQIYASELVLGAGCAVEGQIFHNKLVVEAGCFFEGKSRRHPDPLQLAPVSPQGRAPRDQGLQQVA
jgi:cytoskeletal protein CcmA (bactofilin family)